MQNSIKQVLVSILIGLLVIAFAVWGISDVFTGNGRNAVISLGGDDVTTQDFYLDYQQELSRIAEKEGKGLTNQQAYDRGIPQQILQRLLTQKVLEVDAGDLGVGVNNKSARDFLGDIPTFQDELTGKFSKQKVLEILSRQTPRIPLDAFEQDVINTLRQQQIIPALNSGINAPVEFAEQRYQYLTEQRKAKVLTLSSKAVPKPADPTDEELKLYIDENAARFTAPEYRKITLLRLETYDFIKDLTITDEQIQTQYDLKVDLGEIGSPERRSLVQITANSEADANKVIEDLEKGLAVEDIVKLMGLIEPISYDSVIKEAILDPETAIAAFDMQENAGRAILGSFGNWYAVQVTSITPAENPSIEDMKEEITAELLEKGAEARIHEITDILEDNMIEGATIEEAAKAANFPYSSIDFIDRTGTTPDGIKLSGLPGLEGIAEDETLLREIFVNEQGYETDLFQTVTGGWATFRVEEIRDSKLRPFDDIKTQATGLWQAEKIDAALQSKMQDLAERAQKGESLDALAAELPEGAFVEDVIFLRSAPGNKLSGQVAMQLLKDNIDDISYGAGPRALSRQIAKLTAITANKDSLVGEYADVLQSQVTAALIGDLNNAYRAAVIAEHPYKEYPSKMMQTLGLDAEP